jgi:hypothetical protein
LHLSQNSRVNTKPSNKLSKVSEVYKADVPYATSLVAAIGTLWANR